jgi:hypothetical protein
MEGRYNDKGTKSITGVEGRAVTKNWLENRRNGGRNMGKSKRILPTRNTTKNVLR